MKIQTFASTLGIWRFWQIAIISMVVRRERGDEEALWRFEKDSSVENCDVADGVKLFNEI